MRDEFAIQIGQIGFRNPAQNDVLFDRRAKVVAAEAARDVRELPRLGGRHVAQRKRDGRNA